MAKASHELLKAIVNKDKKRVVELLDNSLYQSIDGNENLPSSLQEALNQPNAQGITALMLAVEQSDPELVKILLEKGANPHIKEKNLSFTPLLKAIASGNKMIAELLLKEPTIKDSPWILSNAVCHAARECQAEILKILLEIYHAPNLPNSGEIPIMWARESCDDFIVQTLSEHFGDEATQRQKDPELSIYLDRSRRIKEYGEIFGLKTKIRIKFPNSKHYELISTEGLFIADAIQLLAKALEEYTVNRSHHEKTKEYFKRIGTALTNEAQYLKIEGKMSAKGLIQLMENQQLLVLPAGWHGYNFNIGIYKNWLVLPSSFPTLSWNGMILYNIEKPIDPQYISAIKSTKSFEQPNFLWSRLLSIVDARNPICQIQDPNQKLKNNSFSNSMYSVKALLFMLRLEELKTQLTCPDEKEKQVLREIGIASMQEAKHAAFCYAQNEYKMFSAWFKEQKLASLIQHYQNPSLPAEDRRIYRDILVEILVHDGKIINSKNCNTIEKHQYKLCNFKTKMKRARLIINALTDPDKTEAIETLNNDKIDLLSPFIKHQDLDIIQTLIKAGASFGLTIRNAAETNDLEVLNCMLNIDLSQKINECDEEGNTALMIAVQSGHFDITKFLLEHGANPGIGNSRTRKTPMSIAKSRSDSCMLNLLLSYQETRNSLSPKNSTK